APEVLRRVEGLQGLRRTRPRRAEEALIEARPAREPAEGPRRSVHPVPLKDVPHEGSGERVGAVGRAAPLLEQAVQLVQAYPAARQQLDNQTGTVPEVPFPRSRHREAL